MLPTPKKFLKYFRGFCTDTKILKDDNEKLQTQVESVQNKAKNIPKQFSENRMKEVKSEKALMGKLREKDIALRQRLLDMQPDVNCWKNPVQVVYDPSIEPEKITSDEKTLQKMREMQVFAAHYLKDSQRPSDPNNLGLVNNGELSTNDGAKEFEPKLSDAFIKKQQELEQEKREKQKLLYSKQSAENGQLKPIPNVVISQPVIQKIPEEDKLNLDQSLAIGLLNALVKTSTDLSQWSNIVQPVQNQVVTEPKPLPANYKTVPCKMYHSPGGMCQRGEFCHFIHNPAFAGRELPPEYWRYPKRTPVSPMPQPISQNYYRQPYPMQVQNQYRPNNIYPVPPPQPAPQSTFPTSVPPPPPPAAKQNVPYYVPQPNVRYPQPPYATTNNQVRPNTAPYYYGAYQS